MEIMPITFLMLTGKANHTLYLIDPKIYRAPARISQKLPDIFFWKFAIMTL